MFAAYGKSLTASSVVFSSKAAVSSGLAKKLGIDKKLYAVEKYPWRHLEKEHDPQRRHAQDRGSIPETYEVRADGELLTCAPAEVLPIGAALFSCF